MKAYQSYSENLVVFTFVPDGIANFIKNQKRQCNYGIYIILKRYNKNKKFQLDEDFYYERDAKEIKSFINDSLIKEVKLSYVFNFIKTFAKSNPKAKIIRFDNSLDAVSFVFSPIQLRDVITASEMYYEILNNKDEYTEYTDIMTKYTVDNIKDISFTKDICKYYHKRSNYKNINSLGYIYFPKKETSFILRNDLLFERKYDGESYKYDKIKLDDYEKLFLDEDEWDAKKRVNKYITETLNKKFSKRNEKRKFLRNNFNKLKELMSLAPYL